jgi:hypothetical protein
MRSPAGIVVAIAFAFLLTACSSVTPVTITAGEICDGCGRPIADVKLAAATVDASGQVLKFHSPGCAAQYLADHPGTSPTVLVTDYQTGRMVRAQTATFVRAVIDTTTRERDYYAFANVRDAIEFGKAREVSPIDWFAIMAQTAASKTTP